MPPPLTNSSSAISRTAATAAPRRSASSRDRGALHRLDDRLALVRDAGDLRLVGHHADQRKPGRVDDRLGEGARLRGRVHGRTAHPEVAEDGASSDASSSRQTRMAARFAGAATASIRSSWATSSTMTVTREASFCVGRRAARSPRDRHSGSRPRRRRSRLGQPERLGQGVRQNAAIAGQGEHGIEHPADPHDLLATRIGVPCGAVEHVVRVGGEGLGRRSRRTGCRGRAVAAVERRPQYPAGRRARARVGRPGRGVQRGGHGLLHRPIGVTSRRRAAPRAPRAGTGR